MFYVSWNHIFWSVWLWITVLGVVLHVVLHVWDRLTSCSFRLGHVFTGICFVALSKLILLANILLARILLINICKVNFLCINILEFHDLWIKPRLFFSVIDSSFGIITINISTPTTLTVYVRNTYLGITKVKKVHTKLQTFHNL